MDSIVSEIISIETKASKQKTKKIVDNIKSEKQNVEPQQQKTNKNKSEAVSEKEKSQK